MGGGQICGIETAVHAVRTASDTEAGLIQFLEPSGCSPRLCPPLATILINTYRAPTELFVDGDTLLSQEGMTQRDPLAMPMYALATIHLINKLKGNSKQIWQTSKTAGTSATIPIHPKRG